MQQTIDSQIQARVRLLLARKWVDLKSLTIGTTNGTVYLGGGLKLTGGKNGEGRGGRTWLTRLRQEICAIPDVNDVVFQFHQIEEEND
ncbi:MAG: hypothetical protein KDA27_21755 [Candidatus Eisenbacteria bacterium]|uniref:Uncharacterized protein n=1 Tax=Eiseniibacteriota bacterium TaxID=2212470 RepID=A0A956SF78_UNCEI|nr:hypothetical protein [Candidatus Eisenbacteria bacterium]MCB9462865.1 hypothetical protein [Candidatus Eisenbacteria bacterium]